MPGPTSPKSAIDGLTLTHESRSIFSKHNYDSILKRLVNQHKTTKENWIIQSLRFVRVESVGKFQIQNKKKILIVSNYTSTWKIQY